MQRFFHYFFLVFILVINNHCDVLYAQYYFKNHFNSEMDDLVNQANIRSVQLFPEEWPFGIAKIELNSNSRIELHFDDLDNDYKDYSYKIIHCDENWNPSMLSETDYLEGFFLNQIEDYNYSSNSSVPYIHYHLSIPNENFQFTKSGNYIIKIMEGTGESDAIIQKRFYVYENLVSVDAEIKYPKFGKLVNQGQEIDFDLNLNLSLIPDPYTQLMVVILQNNDWNKAIVGLQPTFIQNGKLTYQYDQENIFPGGNEFRFFEFKNLNFASQNVKYIGQYDGYYQIELNDEVDSRYENYSFHNDFNGKYVIKNDRFDDSNLESDYAFVHFKIPSKMPISGHRLYIYGELSNYELSKQNECVYNFDENAYILTMLLKQGFYNYNIAVQNVETKKTSFNYFDGDYSQTENQYSFFIYFKDWSQGYTRLIGYATFNSVNK